MWEVSDWRTEDGGLGGWVGEGLNVREVGWGGGRWGGGGGKRC